MVRVCNLCLQIMDGVDDDEDKRSVASTGTGAGAGIYGLSLGVTPGGAVGGWADSAVQSRSPFAASELFSRGHDPLNAIAEDGYAWRGGRMGMSKGPGQRQGEFSPPDTPSEADSEADFGPGRGHARHPLLATRTTGRFGSDSAPFRRGIEEEEREDVVRGPPLAVPASGVTFFVDGRPERSDASATHSAGRESQSMRDGVSSVPFPAGPASSADGRTAGAKAPDQNAGLATQPILLRTRLSSHLSTSGLSGVLLGGPEDGHGVWRSRSDSLV